MKQRIILSLALILSVLLPPVSLPVTAQTQRPQRFTADTGVVSLGPNQMLRVTVAAGDVNGDALITVRSRRMEYTQDVCSGGGVCKLAVSSQSTSPPVLLGNGDGTFFDLTGGQAVRGVVLSNRRGALVTAAIINTLTGETTTQIIMANTEGDF
jgi:hypothetical protein